MASSFPEVAVYDFNRSVRQRHFLSAFLQQLIPVFQMSQLPFLQRYTIQHKEQNSDETILRDKLQGNYVLMKEIEVGGHEDFKRMVEALEAQKQLKHEHLLSLLEYSTTNQMTSEGIKRKLVSFFEYSVHRLQDQIEVRTKQSRPFEQTQMWSIICSPALSLSYLQKQNMGHGCVSVIDIFLTPEGLIKICDPAIASSSPFNFVEGYYYSPELLASFLEQDTSMIEHLDIFKSDVFSLGMCALHAGLLQDCTDCYLYNQGAIDEELLRGKLAKLGEQYSEDYVKVLAVMLELDVDNRPNFIELEECLVELLSNYVDNTNQVQNSLGSMRSVRFLSRPSPTIEQTEPDQEDCRDTLNPKWICSTVSYQNENIDINDEAKASEEQVQTKAFLKAASQSLIGSHHQASMQMSTYYELGRTGENNSLSYGSPRIQELSDSFLKQTYKFEAPKHRHTMFSQNNQNIHMRETYSKENVNDGNLVNMVKRNSKSIIIDNGIPMLGSRASSAYSKGWDLKQSVNLGVNPPTNSIQHIRDSAQLFTDPVLMEIVRTDLKRIQSKPKVTYIYPTY